jgi:GNAT superfamily N-acetyltransferase
VGLVADPPLARILDFCARDPVERVFLEEMARRGTGRFTGLQRDGEIVGLCHAGTNVVPSGQGTGAFADIAVASAARMLIGEERAVGELWAATRDRLPAAREDRPGQPVYVIGAPPEPGGTGLRTATPDDLGVVLPRAAAAHREELGIDPLERDPDGFRLRTRAQIEEGRSWLWLEDGEVRFKAEASAWTPSAVQLAQVWSDPAARGHGYAQRALRDLVRLLLEAVPTVTLFVRTENAPAIRLYERIGMRRALTYRSILF